jgi:thymidylate kinase
MENQLISLEGVDGSGKSEIAKALERTIGGNHFYFPPTEFAQYREDVKELGLEALYGFYLAGNKYAIEDIEKFLEWGHVIAEPYIYSTIAFGAVNLGKNPFMPPGLLEPDQIIYVTASWGEIERRLHKRGDARKDHENVPHLKKFKEVYDQLLTSRDDVITVDTTGRNVEEVVEKLLPKLNLL